MQKNLAITADKSTLTDDVARAARNALQACIACFNPDMSVWPKRASRSE